MPISMALSTALSAKQVLAENVYWMPCLVPGPGSMVEKISRRDMADNYSALTGP
jgi:hypothetical protein